MDSKFIIFTGPESSGKSFLARKMAEKFNLNLLPEQARIYLELYGLEYTQEDLSNIAIQHVDAENNYKTVGEIFLCDTDLITLSIWSKEVFGKVSNVITTEIDNYGSGRYYLLCKPDIPWEYDPQRESKLDRDRLFEIYESTLKSLGLNYSIISGNYQERDELAEKIINKLTLTKGF